MHKGFYASGFLYHPHSKQILLQQFTPIANILSPWLLFGGVGSGEENPGAIFQHAILELLHVKIDMVYPVYSYPYKDTDKSHFIVYSKIRKKENFSARNGVTFAWFSMRQIFRLPLSEQTQHDITVGIRVIDAATRKRLGEHTFQ